MSNAPETTILRTLLAAGDAYTSGSALAATLKMSRVAIWQHMEKLREQGFEFEAKTSRGYRLSTMPEQLSPSLIAAHLGPRPDAPTLKVFPTIDSTNDEALRQLAAGTATPAIIMASEQSKGRGRFGRVWHSAPNGNLYLSFGFRPSLPPARMQTFTLWLGVNLCELIHRFCRVQPALKWPNDVLFEGRKVGGILTEARIDADQIRELVFGLGLNVNSPAGGWPDDLATRAISLAEQTGQPQDINRLAAALIGRMLNAYQQFIAGSYQADFTRLWARYDWIKGRNISVAHRDGQLTGVADGIGPDGALNLRLPDGRTERLLAGEVTLRPSGVSA